MNVTKKNFKDFVSSPKTMVRFHAVMTVVWVLLIIPSLLFWKESVTWVIVMSLWANIAAHWAAFQGAHSEKKQDE